MVALRLFALALVGLATSCASNPIRAPLEAYRGGKYADAAAGFCAALKAPDSAVRFEAEYAFAASLEKLGLQVAAAPHYLAIVEQGSEHSFFSLAVEGLADAAFARDDLVVLVPKLDALYGREPKAMSKLQPKVLQDLHYFIGARSLMLNKPIDARDFLNTVPAGHRSHQRAVDILGIVGQPESATAAFFDDKRRGSVQLWREALVSERALLERAVLDRDCVTPRIESAHRSIEGALLEQQSG